VETESVRVSESEIISQKQELSGRKEENSEVNEVIFEVMGGNLETKYILHTVNITLI
jgi:hypothetical protein